MSDSSDKLTRLNEVLAECGRCLREGQRLVDEDVFGRHPDLMPELAAQLKKLRLVHNARLLAGGSVSPAPVGDAPTTPHLGVPALPFESPREPIKIRYFGDYELLEELGRGGMGVVYKARQVSLNRLVAVKMLLAGATAGQEEIKRFYSEAEAAGHLEHPNIVPIFEVGEHQNTHYFSMAYVRGRSLHELLRDGPLPAKKAAEYLAKVADAIDYAHDHGVLHRDLKPHNILIDEHDQPRVTDFGLAKRVDSDSQLTHTGQILGTPSYMSPEQALGEQAQISPRSDVYSLGATLYAMITGRPPFQAENPTATILQLLAADAVAPKDLNAAVPRDLNTIALKCLEKESAKRYSAASDLRDELTRFLQDRPIFARPIGSFERGWRWARRNPVVAGSALGVSLSLIAGMLVSGYFAFERNQEALRADFESRRAQSKAEAATRSRIAADDARRLEADARQAAEKAARDEAAARTKAELLSTQNQQLAETESAARARAERMFYLSQVRLAHTSLEAQRFAEAAVALDACPWPLRAWEHRYLETQLRAHDPTVFAGGGRIRDVALHPAGEIAVLCQETSHAFVLNLESGKFTRVLKGHQGEINCAAFSPLGDRIVTGSDDRTAKIWDTDSGKLLHNLGPHPNNVFGVAFSADGTRVVTNDSFHREALLWDAESGKLLTTFRGHGDAVRRMALNSTHTRLVTGGMDGTAVVWDTESAKPLHVLRDHRAPVFDVAWSSNDERLYTVGYDPVVRVWDAETGALLKSWRGSERGHFALSLSADNEHLAVGGFDQTVRVWNLKSETLTHTFLGHAAPVSTVRFFSDSNRVLSASLDRTLKIWRLDQSTENQPLKIAPAASAAIHPDGKQIICGGNDGMLRWFEIQGSPRETRAVRAHQGTINSIALSASGDALASGGADGKAKVWETNSGEEVLSVDAHPRTGIQRGVKGTAAVDLVSDGTKLVTGGFKDPAERQDPRGSARVWRVSDGKLLLEVKANMDAVLASSLRPDGELLATGGMDFAVRIYDSVSGLQLPGFNCSDYAVSVLFCPQGRRIAAGGRDGSVRVLDLPLRLLDEPEKRVFAPYGERRLRRLQGNSGRDVALGFNRDGGRLVTGGEDGLLRLWDSESGEHIFTLRGHPWNVRRATFVNNDAKIISLDVSGGVLAWSAEHPQSGFTLRGTSDQINALAFSPDSGALAACSNESARLWDLTTGREIAVLDHSRSPPLNEMVFSRDGRQLITGSVAGTVHVWNATDGSHQRSWECHPHAVRSISLSSDGRRLATAAGPQQIKIWNLESGNIEREITAAFRVSCLSFSSDGKLLTAGGDQGVVETFDLESGETIQKRTGHEGLVNQIVLDSPGVRLASVGSDASLRIWSATSDDCRILADRHLGSIFDAAWISDEHLATGGLDGEVKVWNVPSGELVASELTRGGSAVKVAASPDGKWVAAGAYSGLVKLWRTETLLKTPSAD